MQVAPADEAFGDLPRSRVAGQRDGAAALDARVPLLWHVSARLHGANRGLETTSDIGIFGLRWRGE
jgi:hypothetical protein